MSYCLTDEQARTLVEYFPFSKTHGKDAPAVAFKALLDQESHRRGVPEETTGAFNRVALTQGSLINAEYDLSTHGHWDAWEIGAVIVDPKELILLNQRYSFSVGDAALKAIVTALKGRFPRGKVVRIHVDAFAVLLPPSAETPLEPAFASELKPLLRAAVEGILPQDGEPKPKLDFTISLLRLKIANPSHAQVLGPLIWAECERAHVLERSGQAHGIQERRVDLAGAVAIPR